LRRFTPKEDKFILDNYLKMPMKQISQKLGRADSTARQRLERLGYSVPKEIARRFAMETWRKPGEAPPNKGVPMSKATRKKVKRTWFKPGHRPHNQYDSNGVITTRTVKGRVYLYIRVRKGVWKPLHQQLWRKEHGRIPKGHIVVFRDGDTMNCDIANLELITLQENMKRNTINNLPEDVKKAIATVRGYKRKLKNYEQNHQ